MSATMPRSESRKDDDGSKRPDPTGNGFEWGMKRLNRAHKRHVDRCKKYERREQAWLAGSKNEGAERPQVRFAYQRMDTLMAYITAEKPVGRVKPMHPGQKCEDAAKLMEKADAEWRRRDNRDQKQTEMALTACIFGHAFGKSVWAYERATEVQRVVKESMIPGKSGRLVTREVEVTLMDQPSLVTIDPYDFMWDPSCTSLDDAEFVCQFSYPTLDQLKQGQKEGRYYNIDEVSPIGDRAGSEFARAGRDRDLMYRIEVCEIWDRGRLVTIANRRVCIRDEDSMFQHHKIPFVACSTMPDLWTLEGSSEVEIVAAIQTEMHDFRSAYMFNAKLANKILILLEGDARDVAKVNNALRGEDPISVLPIDNAGMPPTTWQPAAPLIQMGQTVMAGLKQEMDDLSGIGPYISGATEKSVDPKTATEVSALQSGAMRRITAKRALLNRGFEQSGNFDLKNTRQFMSRPLAIRIDKGAGYAWDYVDPQDVVDADLEYVVSDADESIDKEQKRAEATLRLNTALGVAQVAMMLPGSLIPNIAKEYEDFLTAFGVLDPSAYLVAPPPPPPMIAPPPPPPGGSGGESGAAPGSATPPSGPDTGGNFPQ